MNIVLQFTYYVDIIWVPDELQIRKCVNKFDKWLYDKDNNHGYWVIENGKKKGVAFDSETFVDFLNKYVLLGNEPKAYFVKKKAKEYDDSLPTINF